ncbi:unnamed protein product [Symbiodinium necroappetens]|uniref:dihydrolipoyllysine-residue succinyltransferase n=1 Tax=Symbiodinium necroappetens TaxID=1628268 RepID=A0A812P0Q7_9DINO|nr:unnamed protein product [Symbiodinium necroappetens]
MFDEAKFILSRSLSPCFCWRACLSIPEEGSSRHAAALIDVGTGHGTEPILVAALYLQIASLRQDIWRKNGEKAGDPHEEDDRRDDKDVTEMIRWIDTGVMAADPLTKVMEPIKLVHVMQTNELDVKQPIDSIVKKRATLLQEEVGTNLSELAGDIQHLPSWMMCLYSFWGLQALALLKPCVSALRPVFSSRLKSLSLEDEGESRRLDHVAQNARCDGALATCRRLSISGLRATFARLAAGRLGVEAAPAEAPPASVGVAPAVVSVGEGCTERRVPVSFVRQRVMKRLKETQNTAALLSTFQEVDMTTALRLRSKYKDMFQKLHGPQLGMLSLIVKATKSHASGVCKKD